MCMSNIGFFPLSRGNISNKLQTYRQDVKAMQEYQQASTDKFSCIIKNVDRLDRFFKYPDADGKKGVNGC